MVRTVSEELVLKALSLKSKEVFEKGYIIGHIVSFNEKFQKWECSCDYNQIQHKECSHLTKFYIDNPGELRK